MIRIDGSFGEGGGQILRTSLSLSLLTGQPFEMERIRAGRQKPGLLRQHLTAVRAAAEVGHAEVEGAELRSAHLKFSPKGVKPGEYKLSVGSAGSTTLVLQTLLPPLLLADGPTSLHLEGGTHNPLAPPYDFLSRSFLPLLNRLGPQVSSELVRPGFFPAGGGYLRAQITPVKKLEPMDLLERGALKAKRVEAHVAHLPFEIAQRELDTIRKRSKWEDAEFKGKTINGSAGPGNIVLVEIECEHVTEVFAGFGEKGVRGEKVAETALLPALDYLQSDAVAGEHLADQLLLPLALAGKGHFSTTTLSGHTTTNMNIIERFLSVRLTATEIRPNHYRIQAG